MQQKIDQLTHAIENEAASLGLKFVTGPDPSSVAAPDVNQGATNGQVRYSYLFAVAE